MRTLLEEAHCGGLFTPSNGERRRLQPAATGFETRLLIRPTDL